MQAVCTPLQCHPVLSHASQRVCTPPAGLSASWPQPTHHTPPLPVSVERSVSSISAGTSLPLWLRNSTARPLRHLRPGQRDRSAGGAAAGSDSSVWQQVRWAGAH